MIKPLAMGFTEIELVLYFVKALILVKCVALGFTYHIKEEKLCI
jgi:NADH:ubiquinone oxidoreductase subunit 3 (subunit A)